jgi:FdhE protein
MHGTIAGLRTDASRLAGLERDRPEWKTWLALLREVQRELEDDAWDPAIDLVASRGSRVTTADPPLLQQLTLELDGRRLERLVRRFLAVAKRGSESGAAELGGYRPTHDEVVRLVAAEIRGDHASGPLASIAHLAALPVLHACRRQLEAGVPPGWALGYCPICGAWPVLAERRGLDRSRWLRCGGCGGGWEVQALWCSYCGERDHQKLGSLVPEAPGDKLQVDTCETCRGYLKSVAILQALEPFELLLQDLETVELDLVARERGYVRPESVTSRESRTGSTSVAR